MIKSPKFPPIPKTPPPTNSPLKYGRLYSRRYSSGEKFNQKVSRSLSQRFIRAPRFDISQFVWIEEKEKIWILCTILEQDNTILRVQDVESAKIYRVDVGFDEVMPCNKSLQNDMSDMSHIHEPAILYNISRKYLQRHEFYTYIGGKVLVSLNPLTWEYPPMSMDRIVTGNCADIPHPFVFAEKALESVKASIHSKNPSRQTVVISGESGSGKTEASKLIIKYITKRTESHIENQKSGELYGGKVLDKIVLTSPILEAFGNAKTLRNPNSSRFGRYLRVTFGSTHLNVDSNESPQNIKVMGAHHDLYLLEKGRILGQIFGEQNFNIFYQYLSGIMNGSLGGVESDTLQQLVISDSFRLLNSCDSLDVMFDKYKETQSALEKFLAPTIVSDMWDILGGVLQLGNVEFVDSETPEGNTAFISSLSTLQSACTLLKVNWKDLRSLMTRKVISTRDEEIAVPLTLEGAITTRDTVCKSIYDSLFKSIIFYVNENLSAHESLSNVPYIGVLDLFGFETMETNGFNQFMINFANEALQCCFNELMLQSACELYIEEGIDCDLSASDCPDNGDCLAVIASGINGCQGPSSVLALLDAACQQVKGNDEKFCLSLHKTLGNSNIIAAKDENYTQHFLHVHPKDQKQLFKIKHFAGPVTYTVNTEFDGIKSSWVELNRDAVPCQLEDIIASCGSSLSLKIAEMTSSEVRSVVANMNNLSKPKLRTKSVATLFFKSVRELCALLKQSECYYIRCIKPNKQMVPSRVDNAYVISQIRALALVQTCLVNKVGMTISLPSAFIRDQLINHFFTKNECATYTTIDSNVFVSCWLAACGLPENLYSFGKTKVFFQEELNCYLKENGMQCFWETDAELIEMLCSLLPRKSLISNLDNVLRTRKQREDNCSQFKAQVEKLQDQLTSVKALVQSFMWKPTNVPSLAPFFDFFDLAEKANATINIAQCQVNEVNDQLKSLEVRINSSTAPTDEAEVIQRDITQRVINNRSLFNTLITEVSTINSYEKDVRDAVHQAQDKFNETTIGYWDGISQAENMLESASCLITKLDVVRSDHSKFDALSQRIRISIDNVSVLMSINLPNPDTPLDIGDSKRSVCDENFLKLAAEVDTKGKEVIDVCASVKLQCIEAEEEVENAKITLSQFEATTRSILQKIVVFEDTSGDDHGMLWRKSDSGTENVVDEKALSVPAEVSEVDDDTRTESSFEPFNKTPNFEIRPLSGDIQAIEQVFLDAKAGVSDSILPGFFSNDFGDDDDDDDDISVINMDFWVIPHGWEEYFDEDSQTPYYLNTITQVTQWERPDKPAEGTVGGVTWADEDVVYHDNAQEGSVLKSENENEAIRNAITKENNGEELAAPDNVESTNSNCNVLILPSKCNINYGRVTTNQLNSLSTQPKEGHLMKQWTNFFTSGWKRKYFVLDGLRFECYDKSEHFFYGTRKPAVMMLSLDTCTSFTDNADTFVVKAGDDKSNTLVWTLAAPNHNDKNEWVTYINAHVYTHHCNQVAQLRSETSLDRRLLSATRTRLTRSNSTGVEEDASGVSFWQLRRHYGNSKNKMQNMPVSIRTLPCITASRTGEGIFPGEHVEVVGTQEEGGNTFLQLADNRGWLFTLNPRDGSSLFVPAVGYTYRHHESLKFQVADTENHGVPIQYNPGNYSPFTGSILSSGETVEADASFILDLDLQHCLYLKLADGRGWVNTRGKNGGIGMKSIN